MSHYKITNIAIDSSFSKMKENLDKMPEDTTSLAVRIFFLNNLTNMEELEQFLIEIPSMPIELDLSSNSLNSMEDVKFTQLFKKLPQNVNTLNVSRNHLFRRNTETLIEAFRNLPSSLTELNLDRNELENKSTDDLEQIFKALPRTLTTLKLSDDFFLQHRKPFSTRSIEEVSRLFAALPPNLTNLELGYSKLLYKTMEARAQAINVLPRTLTALDLTGNGISSILDSYERIDPREVALIVAQLPPALTTLNLSYNGLDNLNDEGLIQVFNALPSTLTSLGLSTSDLKNRNLELIFAALPALTSLTLTVGQVIQTPPSLMSTLLLLPKRITSLDLSTIDLKIFIALSLKMDATMMGKLELPQITKLSLDENQVALLPKESRVQLGLIFPNVGIDSLYPPKKTDASSSKDQYKGTLFSPPRISSQEPSDSSLMKTPS